MTAGGTIIRHVASLPGSDGAPREVLSAVGSNPEARPPPRAQCRTGGKFKLRIGNGKLSEEKTRDDDWKSCLTEEQLFFLNAWNRTSAYTVADVFLGKVKICKNPNCRKLFSPRNARQYCCTRTCGRKFRQRVYSAAYRAKHRTELRAVMYFGRLRYEESLESDPVKYAHHLELKRRANHRCWEKKHPGCRPYKPMLSRRIPDWAVKGQVVVDRGSVFLSGNMSDEQVMAANDFALQQNAGEERHRPKIKTVFRK